MGFQALVPGPSQGVFLGPFHPTRNSLMLRGLSSFFFLVFGEVCCGCVKWSVLGKRSPSGAELLTASMGNPTFLSQSRVVTFAMGKPFPGAGLLTAYL